MCWPCMYALKIVGFRFDLFGQPVILHLERLRSSCAHFEYFWSLHIRGWICDVIGEDGVLIRVYCCVTSS